MVVIKDGKFSIYTTSGESVERASEKMEIDYGVDELEAFTTFTEKEIHDIPAVLENVFNGRVNFEERSIYNETLERLGEYDVARIEIIASGSSYYA